MENPWTNDEVAMVHAKLHVYLMQFLLAKNLMSVPELQNLLSQMKAKLQADPNKGGSVEYLQMLARELKGINL